MVPVPLHAAHTCGVPTAPVPWQVSQASSRVPEIDFELILERAAFFGFFFGCAAPAAAAKELAEQIAEAGAAGAAGSPAEIETAEIKVDVARSAARAGAVVARGRVVAVEAVLVIHLALLGVGENVVGFLQLFEFLFGRFVA